jgi:hypothetical protein
MTFLFRVENDFVYATLTGRQYTRQLSRTMELSGASCLQFRTVSGSIEGMSKRNVAVFSLPFRRGLFWGRSLRPTASSGGTAPHPPSSQEINPPRQSDPVAADPRIQVIWSREPVAGVVSDRRMNSKIKFLQRLFPQTF